MLVSRSCEYGMQAVLYLAEQRVGTYTLIRDIANEKKIPFHFLGKILQNLSKNGILVSYKGPSGGFTLAKPLHEITLLQVVEAIDGLDFMNKCVIGLPQCSDEHPCSLHEPWKKIRANITEMLVGKSLAELVKEAS